MGPRSTRPRTIVTLVVATAALVLASTAGAAGPTPAWTSVSTAKVLTKQEAYKAARACLLTHGARFVGRRGDGGGFVFFRGVPHVQYWTYKTFLGLVDSVTYYTFPGLPRATKRTFVACITKGI